MMARKSNRIAASALCGVVAMTGALVNADTFTWHGPNDAVGSGNFGTAGNWFDSSNARTLTIPGASDDVKFTNGNDLWSVQTVTLDTDRSVASLMVEGGNVRALGKVAYAALALDGHVLTVSGQLYMEGIQGWGSYRAGQCSVRGGTLNVGSVQVGRTGEWGQGSGTLIVKGSGTALASSGEVKVEGPFTKLEVSDGATLSGGKFRVAGQRANRSAVGGSGFERSTVAIANSGTKVTLTGFALHHDVDMTISDGAFVKVTGWGYYNNNFSGFWIGSLGRTFYGNCIGGAWGGYGTSCGNYGTLVIDNATFESSDHFAIGCARAALGGEGATLTLQNGAKFSSGELFVGLSGDGTGQNSTNNVLNVLSGSELKVNSLTVSRYGNTPFCKMNVSNATVKCETLRIGGYTSSVLNSNACLTVSGAAPGLTLSSTSATAFEVRMGSQVRFVLPEDGFASAPILVKGGVSIIADENDYAVDPVRLVIDANAFGRKHPNETATLIECATASAESLQRLADNLVFVDTLDRRKGKVAVVGGTKLVYTAPPPLGTKLVIR
ncbi:MAG: hypothetical protein IKQ17_02405 [Kiritimatiellae bacterium]|nr:hypothetical protein [Kiritimatiellia bacterium]